MKVSNKLQENWTITTCAKFCTGRSKGFNPLKEEQKVYTLYSVPSHASGIPERLDSKDIGSNKQFVATGDVLISKINPRLNRTWVVSEHHEPPIASTEWIVFRKNDVICSEYLALFLQQFSVRDFLSHNASGVGGSLTRIKPAIFEEVSISYPLLNEQKRIVAKIEELFSELDAGEQSLREARQQLTLYRQSLLKQAFEGKLTETWRANTPDKLEAPETLLTRIQQERDSSFIRDKEAWVQAFEKWQDDGEIGKKPPKPKKHKPTRNNAENGYTNFCTDWNKFNLSQLVITLRQGWSPKCHNHPAEDGDWSVMTTTAIQQGHFLPNANKLLPKNLHPRPWITLAVDDILITRAGPRSRCGVVCRVTLDKPKMMLCDKAYRLRFPKEIICPKFIEFLLISPDFTRTIEALKTGISDSGLNITQTGFLQLLVGIPSLEEQQEIVRLLDEQFTAIEQNEKEITHSLTQSQALRQSILKKAFSGKLL